MQESEKNLRVEPGLVIPLTEIRVEFSRSGGPGGQHVNKVSTRASVAFDINLSRSIEPDQRDRLLRRLKKRIGSDGVLRVTEQRSRSQWRNRQEALKRLLLLLQEALKEPKKRVPTRSTTSGKEKRLHSKRIRSIKKQQRRLEGGE